MDPTATYHLMIDETNDLDTRAVAATDLLVWLANGGVRSFRAAEPEEAIDLARYTIFKALDALAATTKGEPA